MICTGLSIKKQTVLNNVVKLTAAENTGKDRTLKTEEKTLKRRGNSMLLLAKIQ